MDILNLFKQFKLGNSVFSAVYNIPKYEKHRAACTLKAHDADEKAFKHFEDAVEHEIKRQMVDSLSNAIITKNQSAIKTTEKEHQVEYKVELLVLKVEDFKTIVEAAILMMPMEAIVRLRANGQVSEPESSDE